MSKTRQPKPVPARPAEAEKARGAGNGWDVVYGALLIAFTPWLAYKSLRTGKYRRGWKERLGHVPPRPSHPARVWFHGVSVGETLAAESPAAALKELAPEAEVVFSATTDTGLAVARKTHGEDHAFRFPLDFSRPVRRAFDHVQPALIVLMELEVWPNFTAEAARRGIPVVVVNGRITARSARRYRLAWPLLRASFRRVRLWLMQSEEYAARLRELGVEERRIIVSGNVKYDAVDTTPPPPEERAALRKDLGLEPAHAVLIGGSTHPGEEKALLDACNLLQEQHPALRLILVPRHPERLAGVEEEIKVAGHTCIRLSTLREHGAEKTRQKAVTGHAPPVLLVDTMGELGRLYRAADFAFVGGSLIPHGGQNVMEPAGIGLPVVFGPHMHNFTEAVEILTQADGARQVSAGTELPGVLEEWLKDPAAARLTGEKAAAALQKRQGASKYVAEYLKLLLHKKRAAEA